MAGKGLLRGLAAPGTAFLWKLGLPVPGIGPVAAPDLTPSPSSPFHPPRAFRPGRSDMPVPNDPYLDTALSHGQHRHLATEHPRGCHGLPKPSCKAQRQSRALPVVIALCPGVWPQRSQLQSFVSPSLPGPVDFLNAPFPISSLLGRGSDNVWGTLVMSLLPGRQSMPMGPVRIPSIRPHRMFSGLLIGKKNVIYEQQA